MNFEFFSELITENKESRIRENLFSISLPGFLFYPIDKKINVLKTAESKPSGTAVIKKISWSENNTTLEYELLSLNSIN